MTGCHYDDDTHVYHIDRIAVPSVTESLFLGGHIDKRFYNADAAERGRRVHHVTEQLDVIDGRHPIRKELQDQFDIATDIEGEAQAYIKFCLECKPRYRTIERPFWNRRRKVGGRPDRTLRSMLDYQWGVLEVKTGSKQPWHAYQTAGYVSLDPVHAGGPRWVVYLLPNGLYKLELFKDADDHRVFAESLSKAHDVYGIAA